MQLTEHFSYIIHSAKTIAYARDYKTVEPEHLMLALFYDENDLPKFILEKIKLNNLAKALYNLDLLKSEEKMRLGLPISIKDRKVLIKSLKSE